RNVRHAVGRGAWCVLEAEAVDLPHSGDKEAWIEPADHVALALVLTRTEVTTVYDAGVGMDAAAAVAFKAGRAPERRRMARGVVPEPLGLGKVARGLM
ncbi:MAG: hypothetical protein ACK5PF_06960, partial [bacterium]